MNSSNKIQIINGPGGKPFFVAPNADFIHSSQAKQVNVAQRIIAPEDASIPHEVVQFMVLPSMTPMRAWREYLGLSQADLAARIGFTLSAYSQQEAAPKDSKATLEKIADALGIMPVQLDVQGGQRRNIAETAL